MRYASLSAMALLLAALPNGAEAQANDWWDWTLRNVDIRAEVANGPSSMRDAPRVTYVEPARVAVRRDGYNRDGYGSDSYGRDAYGRDGRGRDAYGRDDRGRERNGRDAYDRERGSRERERWGGERGSAPSFCRSGAGHPVFGRKWCVDKGYGLGVYRSPRVRWERQRWSGVRFDRRWYGARPDAFDARVLIDILGGSVYGRLDVVRQRMGGRYALTGRWIEPRRGVRVLQVRSGPMAVAELTDLNGDGRVDVVLVAGL